MAIATLSWIPGGGGDSISQDIHYKTIDEGVWTFHSNVSASTDTVDITGLTNNVIYQFRVTNKCISGGGSTSDIVEAIEIMCPDVAIETTGDSATFTFTHLGGDITDYQVDLLNSGDVVIDTIYVSSPGVTVSNSFTSLSGATSYKIRVIPSAIGSLDTYTQECPSEDLSTLNYHPIDVIVTNVVETHCGGSVITIYVSPEITTINDGVVVYSDTDLTTPLTGFTFISDNDIGDIYELDPVTGLVGDITIYAC